jgi:hypothetical protein
MKADPDAMKSNARKPGPRTFVGLDDRGVDLGAVNLTAAGRVEGT